MRKMVLGLALCLALSGCGGSPAEEPAEAQGLPVQVIGPEEDWQEVYVKFLEDLCEEEKAILNMERPDYDPNDYPAQVENLSKEYFLYDLDWDGVPELVLRSGWDSWDTRFYTVRDGEVTEAGRRESRYISFFTSPDRPGIIVQDTPKGPVFVYRLTLEDGELRQGDYLYETDMEKQFSDLTYRMEDVVPGAAYIRGCRTMAEWPEHTPLTLPVDDYGRKETAAEPDPERDGAARSLILAALEEGTSFCAVSGDGWGGDAGWTTMEEYLQPGGIEEYAEKPLVPRRRCWVDLDGDGQRECVLYVERDPEDFIRDGCFLIFSEQQKDVYAYCLNYIDRMDVTADGVFFDPWYLEEGIDGGVWRLSFGENLCYQYTAAYDASAPLVEWEALD
ncbi:MAG: hypothetical protein HFG12_07390 [Oscillibacter sp.]|jgi:hypothetical protein|nr:hypothetical protein [uncultured Oscillibacter sp.]MCI8813041.1 hypothetical protein [Oscillibacter sp.]